MCKCHDANFNSLKRVLATEKRTIHTYIFYFTAVFKKAIWLITVICFNGIASVHWIFKSQYNETIQFYLPISNSYIPSPVEAHISKYFAPIDSAYFKASLSVTDLESDKSFLLPNNTKMHSSLAFCWTPKKEYDSFTYVCIMKECVSK